MKQKSMQWTIRIITHPIAPDGLDRHQETLWEAREGRDMLWLGEILRYAGYGSRCITEGHNSDRSEVYELMPPKDIPASASNEWAHRNAERIKTFGINAVAAPKWGI